MEHKKNKKQARRTDLNSEPDACTYPVIIPLSAGGGGG